MNDDSDGCLEKAILDLNKRSFASEQEKFSWAKKWSKLYPKQEAILYILVGRHANAESHEPLTLQNKSELRDSGTTLRWTLVCAAWLVILVAAILFRLSTEQILLIMMLGATPFAVSIGLRAFRFWPSTAMISSGLAVIAGPKLSFGLWTTFNSLVPSTLPPGEDPIASPTTISVTSGGTHVVETAVLYICALVLVIHGGNLHYKLITQK